MVKFKARLVLRAVNILGGLVLINLAYVAAFLLRFKGTLPAENFVPYTHISPSITLASMVFLVIYGMYSNARKTIGEVISSVFCIMFLVSVTAVALSYFYGKFAFPRTVFVISAALQVPLLVIWFRVTRRMEQAAHGTRNAILVGDYQQCLGLSVRLERESLSLLRVRGIVVNDLPDSDCQQDMRVIGTWNNFQESITGFADDLVILCSTIEPRIKLDITCYCLANNISLFVIPEIYEILLAQSNVFQIGDTMLFKLGNIGINSTYRWIKRAMDIAIAVFGLLFLAFPMLLIALFIKIDSAGPIFYCQDRVGENGRIFKLFKFRSMINDAEINTGPVLANSGDPRTTRLGRILRSTRLDELPQLLNVIKGEMSLVGPRPERPYFVEKFSQEIPSYEYRHLIKPGITGLAQVQGNYCTLAEDKLRMDLLYANNYSPLGDFHLILQTLKVILMKDKAS